jgi:formylglycine-generating enzyme required for sulfatase activity
MRWGFAALAIATAVYVGCSSSSTGGSGGDDAGTKDATSGVEAGVDTGIDTGIDTGVDAGFDSGIDTGVDSGPVDSGSEAAPCDSGATQCSGNGVETCTAGGSWGSPVACASSQSCSGGACAAIPSCAPGGVGMTNCGASSESCCTSLEVPGGTFYRTYDPVNFNDGGWTLAADGGPTGEADPATVTGFRLDKYEVTVGRFRQFVNAWSGGTGLEGGAGYEPPAGSGKHAHLNGGKGLANSASAGMYETGWVTTDDGNISPTATHLACSLSQSTWTASASSQDTMPINCVSWYEAYAFCIWDGGFLPSEAEWEYAAAGGSQQLEYPWGATDPGAAIQYAVYAGSTPSGIEPVGTATLGAGAWGQLDLAGNLEEWALDSFANGYVDPCTDCASLTATALGRLNRGGWFSSPESYLLPAYREGLPPAQRSISTGGMRCARTP